jgi:hypothetical protein
MTHHVEIKLNPTGRGTILVDGIDVSSHTFGIEIKNNCREGTTVRVQLAAGKSVDFAAAVAHLELSGACPMCGSLITIEAK